MPKDKEPIKGSMSTSKKVNASLSDVVRMYKISSVSKQLITTEHKGK